MNILEAFQTVGRLEEIAKTMATLYGEKWPEIRDMMASVIWTHHCQNKTTNPLASAIALSKEEKEPAQKLLILGAYADSKLQRIQ